MTQQLDPTTENVIVIDGLKKTFRLGFTGRREFQALKGISLTVQRGSVFGFLGPNGAGKTTTIKAVTGLITADAGTISILGGLPSDAAIRKRLGFLPENPSFPDHLTGQEILGFSAALVGILKSAQKDKIGSALEAVKLSHAARLQVRRYSKGMVQRLGIAQAILHDPDLLILDEPMSGLDPLGRRDVKDLIHDLGRQGRTIFFSTHIISDVEAICDHAAIVVGGNVVRSGPVSDLLGNEQCQFEVIARDVPKDFETEGSRNLNVAISFLRPDHAQARGLVETLWSRGAQVVQMNVRKYSLEDVFLEEVKKRPNQARVED